MQPEKNCTAHHEAREIIASPQPQHTASLRLLAWATLKAERGQTICQRLFHSKPIQADLQVA